MISSHFQCYDCECTGPRRKLDVITLADDGDQMYGRALSGTVDVLICPECGSENIDDWYNDEDTDNE